MDSLLTIDGMGREKKKVLFDTIVREKEKRAISIIEDVLDDLRYAHTNGTDSPRMYIGRAIAVLPDALKELKGDVV
jgi:hypothetical protein